MRSTLVLLLVAVASVAPVTAFVPRTSFAAKTAIRKAPAIVSRRPVDGDVAGAVGPTTPSQVHGVSVPAAATAAAVLFGTGLPAHAASEVAGSIPSALAAYGHYLGLLLVGVSLTVERFLIKPGMSPEDEKTATNADIVYGIAGVLVLVTGYLRVTQYGKGWEVRAVCTLRSEARQTVSQHSSLLREPLFLAVLPA
jgi:hypothetical protein